MKSHFFHLMPYKHLPEDFARRHPSVWVDVPSSLYDPLKGHANYNEYLDELEYADQEGFDGVCVNEHHSNAYGMMPSPNLMLAALSRRTRRAALVVLGNSLALYNPPIRVAEEMAMLDVISGGRFVAGFPVGSSMDANFAYGQTPATLREKYREAHESGDPRLDDAGAVHVQRKIHAAPLRQHLAASDSKAASPGVDPRERQCRDLGMGRPAELLLFIPFLLRVQAGDSNMQGYWEAVERMGRDHNPFRAGFLQLVAISDSDARAEAEYAEAASYFYHRCLHVPDHFFAAPGYMTLKSLKAIKTPFSFDTLKKLRWRDFVEEGYIIAGSPATVRERLSAVVRELNVGHLMVLLQFGNLSKEQTLRNTELYAREVMPHLRGLWSDWLDHWYPKPLCEPERASEPARPEAATQA